MIKLIVKNTSKMDLKDIVAEVIDSEIRGLEDLKQNFDFESLNEILEKIYLLSGKVILSGIGKSGYISKKIAASLCSIGLPAVFLHSGEALHGDLGVISSNDIVLIFSNSGEGSELKQIIDYCERFKVTTVGISRNKSSYLIEKTDIGIHLPATPEVTDLDIPTTSTMMMMAFGDILTIALKERKQLSHENYLIYHPGGTIGFKGMKVYDLMLKADELVILKYNCSMIDALFGMLNKRLRFALIVDDKDEFIGIINDTSIKDFSFKDNIVVENFISNNYKVLSSELKMVDILQDINTFDYFIVLDGKKPIGAFSYDNIKSIYKC